jgi:hypothetical protein
VWCLLAAVSQTTAAAGAARWFIHPAPAISTTRFAARVEVAEFNFVLAGPFYTAAHDILHVIYQIDAHCRRSQATLRQGLKALGLEVVKGLRFVCSDMWKPYLQVNGEEPIMRRKVLGTNKNGVRDTICSS